MSTAHRLKATDQISFSAQMLTHLPRASQSSLGPTPTPYLCLFSMVVQAQVGGQVHIRCQELSLKAESGLHSLRERKELGSHSSDFSVTLKPFQTGPGHYL